MPENDATAGAGDNTETHFNPVESQEDLDRIIEKRLARERQKFANYDELAERAAKLDEIEQANQSELEKAIQRAEAAEAAAKDLADKASQAELKALVERVAGSKNVPSRYLSGTTEEELIASADQFLTDLEQFAPRQQSGYVPGSGTGDPNASVDEIKMAQERAANQKL